MTDDRDPEKTLEDWKTEMQAEHETRIENPDPEGEHRIEGVAQVNYRLTFAYDADADALERVERTQVNDLSDPELLSCSCGVRGMTREEARDHVAAARQD